MAFQGNLMVPFLKIVMEGVGNLVPKVYNGLIAALAPDFDSVIFKIHVVDVQSDALGNTDSRPQ